VYLVRRREVEGSGGGWRWREVKGGGGRWKQGEVEEGGGGGKSCLPRSQGKVDRLESVFGF